MICKKCGYNKLREQPVSRLYNEHGEFVEGYGHNQVWIQVDIYYICEACGFDQSKSLDKILPNPWSAEGKALRGIPVSG